MKKTRKSPIHPDYIKAIALLTGKSKSLVRKVINGEAYNPFVSAYWEMAQEDKQAFLKLCREEGVLEKMRKKEEV